MSQEHSETGREQPVELLQEKIRRAVSLDSIANIVAEAQLAGATESNTDDWVTEWIDKVIGFSAPELHSRIKDTMKFRVEVLKRKPRS